MTVCCYTIRQQATPAPAPPELSKNIINELTKCTEIARHHHILGQKVNCIKPAESSTAHQINEVVSSPGKNEQLGPACILLVAIDLRVSVLECRFISSCLHLSRGNKFVKARRHDITSRQNITNC